MGLVSVVLFSGWVDEGGGSRWLMLGLGLGGIRCVYSSE